MSLLTVVILTGNEERHIARCLDAIAPLESDVVVVDSFSTDRTFEIARQRGARVRQHRFTNYSRQFQWALDNCSIATPWIMRLDADEVIEPDLAETIVRELPGLGGDVAGVNLNRKHIFMGRWIRHGGRYPLTLLRIWRAGQGRIENRWMDEHMIVWGGRVVTFDGGFADHNLNNLTFFVDKHNKYATREAIDVLNTKYRLLAPDNELSANFDSRQASIKRRLKESIYNRLPFWAGPFAYFVFRYVIQLGFLDGREGLIYHFLQGFWYRFLVAARVVEYDAVLSRCAVRKERLAALERLTGHRLAASEAPDGARTEDMMDGLPTKRGMARAERSSSLPQGLRRDSAIDRH
jgi:glycosyltransferase involved in cell wall biosynthesis